MSDHKITYLSLGSNLGNKLNNIQNAVFELQKRVGDIVSISNVYQSPAWGFESDDFLNICTAVKTGLSPHKLLETILGIESELGRERNNGEGYKPRTIDIDILYYDTEIIETKELTLPHPNLHKRMFVLKPLADIAPQFYHPILKNDTRNLLQECKDKNTLTKTAYTLHKTRTALFSKLHFIAIEGNIGAGKTSLVKKISEDFNAKLILERFADNPFFTQIL